MPPAENLSKSDSISAEEKLLTEFFAANPKGDQLSFLDIAAPVNKGESLSGFPRSVRTTDCHRRANDSQLNFINLDRFFDRLRSKPNRHETPQDEKDKTDKTNPERKNKPNDGADKKPVKIPQEIPDNGPLPKLQINGKEETYPESKRFDYEDSYGKSKIADPYQWLEKTDSKETKDWVKKQTDLTERYLAGIPQRADLLQRLEKVYDYEQRCDMWKQGDKYYVWKQDGKKEQPELCVMDNLGDKPRTILAPSKLSADGHGIVRNVTISNDGNFAKFNYADCGQDKTRTVIYDIQAQKETTKLPKGVSFEKREPSVSIGSHPEVLANIDSGTLLMSNKNAQNNKIVLVDEKTGESKDIIPETKDLLLETKMVGGKILAHYLNDACSELKLFDTDGKLIKNIDLPGRGSVRSINGSDKDKDFFFTYSNFTTPNMVIRCDASTGNIHTEFQSKPSSFNPNDFVTEEKVCKSKDGTPVHLFIVHKKGLELDGKNPAYLHGYGGFGINRTPVFDNGNIPWLQDGGILVVSNLRGGAEYGEKWHQGGTGVNKQNVFDDYISSAQYLIDNKYTNGSKLSIGGRSNGGLLVGATLVQRPDMFAAAIPEVGLFDMLRFPQIGPGASWQQEYGYPSNPKDFQNFLKYSPLHNLKRGVGLPAVLTMTEANDDRVIPSHSFKFTAAAQRAQANEKNAVLLYVGARAGHAGDGGHGFEKARTQQIEEYASKWAFLKKAMNIKN